MAFHQLFPSAPYLRRIPRLAMGGVVQGSLDDIHLESFHGIVAYVQSKKLKHMSYLVFESLFVEEVSVLDIPFWNALGVR